MSRKRIICPFLRWFILIGLTGGIEIEFSFKNPEDGFFLKSPYNKYQMQDTSLYKENFIITGQAQEYDIVARTGTFEVEHTVPWKYLDNSLNAEESSDNVMHHSIVFDMHVSAHIITDKLSPKWPVLQVLLHASPKLNNSKLCGQVFVQNNEQELTDVCSTNEKVSACVVNVALPVDWWQGNGSSIHIFYSVSKAEQSQECRGPSNSIVPDRGGLNATYLVKKHITVLNLRQMEENYVIYKDQHIIFYVPTETFHPGTRFEIPVKLEANSDLQNIVMRARIRNGLKVIGVVPNAASPWTVHIDIKNRQKTCTISGSKNYSLSSQIQDIFGLLLEVDSDMSEAETARIVWSIEYERNNHQEYYTSRESRVISHINLQGSEQEKIVLVHKHSEILNLAILTGQRQSYPLQVYAVTNSGKVFDVSHLTACHSAENDIVKVEADCTALYVDGSESRGSHNATIIAKSGRYTTWMQVRIWIPEEMLDIELTDSRLSQIQGWRISRYHRSSRKPRGLDNYLKDDADRFVRDRSCHPRLQQSLVDIYARFLIQTSGKTDYYKSKKASFKMSQLLSHRLRISDPRIAKLDGVVIHGEEKGRTEIQVLSPTGRVLAAKEIRVGNDKVVIERLIVKLVTGISLDLAVSEDVSGALTAISVVEDKILSKYQEGILDIAIHFSDNTNFPLEFVAPEDYFLEVSSLNTRIIGIAPYVKPYQPRVVSYGQGHGELLKVFFKLGDHCMKKKSRPLAIEYITLDADFQQRLKTQMGPFQSDAHFDNNRASDRHKLIHIDNEFKITTVNDDVSKVLSRSKILKLPKIGNKDLSDTKLIPIDIDFAENVAEESPEYSQTKQEPLHLVEKKGLTPLEIGMYVLLAVFCVAIAVFMINCIVFMVRYKRKRMPKGVRETVSQAHDWVWIGKATLERNAVNTRCSQTLMPEEDFNGNRTRLASGSNSASSSAQSSNRNSTVSTYKGSECSIRITANPHPATIEEANNNPTGFEPQWDYEEMGMTYDQLMDYFANLKESNA